MRHLPLEPLGEPGLLVVNPRSTAGDNGPDKRLGVEDDTMVAAIRVPMTDQYPVSVMGWALALVGGAGLWMLMLAGIH